MPRCVFAAESPSRRGQPMAGSSRAQVAYAEAQRAEASGRDWAEPLIALRNSVEPEHRVWHRDIWWPRFRVELIVLSGIGLVISTIGPRLIR